MTAVSSKPNLYLCSSRSCSEISFQSPDLFNNEPKPDEFFLCIYTLLFDFPTFQNGSQLIGPILFDLFYNIITFN
jgi:hypothetical protein